MILPKIIKSYNQNNNIIIFCEKAAFSVMFQSYDKIMFVINSHGVILNEELSDHTKTTRKYMYKALEDLVYDSAFFGFISSSNYNTIKNILSGDKNKNILQHMKRQTSYIYNDVTGATICYKDFI